jgi:hypothetical protein
VVLRTDSTDDQTAHSFPSIAKLLAMAFTRISRDCETASNWGAEGLFMRRQNEEAPAWR